MCGRYMITSPFQAMADLFEATLEHAGVDAPRLNVSPTQSVPVVRADDGGGRRIVAMRWGFLPHWYKTPADGPLLINARAETLAEKPAFRAAARARRCLIPADGFYEWKAEGRAKVPHVIRAADGGLIAFAGVWQDWTAPDGTSRATCTIVTCAANATLEAVHHRMPVVIAAADTALWLGEAGPGAAVLMRPAPDDCLAVAPADADTRALLARRVA